MPISFTCPHCGTTTDVAEQYAGQTGPCSSCGQSITVPNPFNATPQTSSNKTTLIIFLVVAVIGLGMALLCAAALLLPAISVSRGAAREAMCQNNLKQIGMAMQNYHAANGSFPPAYVADENGEPLYSWRVLLLPYMEQQWLYDQFHLDEPWDSSHNLALLDMMPDIYRCPDAEHGATSTSYVMITGPECLFDGPNEADLSSITDGTSFTIMLVESADSGIGWTEPRDLSSDSITFAVNDGSAEGLRSDHVDGCNVLFCDGSVRSLDESIDRETIRAMATKAGGEAVGGYEIDY